VEAVPTEGISRPLAEVLKELGKRIPDSLVRSYVEDGVSLRYVPWLVLSCQFSPSMLVFSWEMFANKNLPNLGPNFLMNLRLHM
jgi:hypothetical protein